MLFMNALTKGMVGGYLSLSLLVSAGALTRLDDPQSATAFLQQARWVPGAARLEVALRDAWAKQPQLAGARVTAPSASAPASAPGLSELQKLRQRTYGDPNNPGAGPKQ